MLPVITISRQFGSGGHEVGEKLAKRLDLPFYDKELIALAAKKSGLSEEVFADVDEKATSSLLYSMVMGSYAFGTRVPGINEMPINDKLFIIQSDIIKKAAQEGPCVIVGRCADYNPAGTSQLPERVRPRQQSRPHPADCGLGLL